MSSYSDVLKKNLKESLFSALTEEEFSAEEIFETLKEEIASFIEYHKNNLSKAQTLYDRISREDNYISIGNTCLSDPFSTAINYDFMGNIPGSYTSDYIDFQQYVFNDDKINLNYTDEELNAMCDAAEQEEKKKWTVPIEVDGPSGEYFITLPDEVLEKVGWSENDELEWIDQKDGSFLLRKIENDEYYQK